jgi:hypothetical protein
MDQTLSKTFARPKHGSFEVQLQHLVLETSRRRKSNTNSSSPYAYSNSFVNIQMQRYLMISWDDILWRLPAFSISFTQASHAAKGQVKQDRNFLGSCLLQIHYVNQSKTSSSTFKHRKQKQKTWKGTSPLYREILVSSFAEQLKHLWLGQNQGSEAAKDPWE